jgi:hypothetical protein
MRVGVSGRPFGLSSKASGRMQEKSKEHKADVIRDAEPQAEIQARDRRTLFRVSGF